MKQGGGDDEQLCAAWGQVGAYYTERGKWGKAAQYFKQAKDLGMMAECYYRCDTYVVPDLLSRLLSKGSFDRSRTISFWAAYLSSWHSAEEHLSCAFSQANLPQHLHVVRHKKKKPPF